jgi:hypothetical protein
MSELDSCPISKGVLAGRGTMDQLFALNEITAIRREMSLATFVCFIDVSKAYDKV